MKHKKEGSELSEKIGQLKMKAADERRIKQMLRMTIAIELNSDKTVQASPLIPQDRLATDA